MLFSFLKCPINRKFNWLIYLWIFIIKRKMVLRLEVKGIISEISKAGKYFVGKMWINRSSKGGRWGTLTRNCDIQIPTFLSYTHFQFPKKPRGLLSAQTLLPLSHTSDNRMRSIYSCCVYYWHVHLCIVLSMNAYILCADSIPRSLHIDITPSFPRSSAVALLVSHEGTS